MHIRIPLRQVLSSAGIFIATAIIFIGANYVFATTPDPGHPWAGVGDGTFQVTGPSTLRTYTFPDANETVLTTAGSPLSGTVPYGNGTGVLATTTAGTNGFVLALSSGVPTWIATTTLANISGTLGLAGGGTNASLTASNGGIVWSNASQLQVLAGTATANKVLMSGSSATPSWSTPTYPNAASPTARKIIVSDGTNWTASTETYAVPGTSGNVLTSNGTNWTSAAPSGGGSTMTTVITRPASGLGTGANAAVALASLTVYIVGLFNIPYSITVNQLAYNVGAVTTAGSYRICVYNEAGTTKSIDVTDVPAAGVNTVAVGAVTLTPGNYYIAMGCATTCNNTIFKFTSIANTMINTSAVPAGKKVYEGTATMTSGTCNATLPTITGVISDTAVVRLDN